MPEQESEVVSAQGLSGPWFGVEHGLDNYEDAFRLDEVQSFSASFTPTGNGDNWDVGLTVKLRHGGEATIRLNENGYRTFLTRLNSLETAPESGGEPNVRLIPENGD